jgi:hypothetical protein
MNLRKRKLPEQDGHNKRPKQEQVPVDIPLPIEKLRWKEIPTPRSFPAQEGPGGFIYKDMIHFLVGRTEFGVGADAGYKDIFIYDIKLDVWSAETQTGQVPNSRFQQSLTLIGNELISIGGTNQKSYYHDVCCLNLETYEWKVCGLTGDKINSNRCKHAVGVLGKHIYLAGGEQFEKTVKLRDCFRLDCTNSDKLKVTALASMPVSLFAIRGFCTPKDFYVFGGINAGQFQHVLKYNIAKDEWQSCEFMPFGFRCSFGLVYSPFQNVAWLFGGYNSQLKKYYNDLWKYEPEYDRWEEIQYETDENVPIQCAYGLTMLNRESVLYQVGGFNGQDYNKKLTCLKIADPIILQVRDPWAKLAKWDDSHFHFE